MKTFLIAIYLILAFLTAHAQKVCFQGTLGVKKSILYNNGQLLNSDNAIRLVTKPNPYFEINVNYNLTKISLQSGLALFTTKYWAYYDFRSSNAGFNQQFGLGITSVQLPLRILYKLTDKIKIGLGIAVTYHSYNRQSYRDNYYGVDSFDIEWSAKGADFNDYISLSNQAIACFEPFKHWGMYLIADIDWRQYPFMQLQDKVTRKEKVIKNSTFSGSPKMLYLALGISYRI